MNPTARRFRLVVCVMSLAGCISPAGFQNQANPELAASHDAGADRPGVPGPAGAHALRVHNSTFDLAFHPWREPMDRLAALATARGIDLATPLIGAVLTVGKPRVNALWWAKLR